MEFNNRGLEQAGSLSGRENVVNINDPATREMRKCFDRWFLGMASGAGSDMFFSPWAFRFSNSSFVIFGIALPRLIVHSTVFSLSIICVIDPVHAIHVFDPYL